MTLSAISLSILGISKVESSLELLSEEELSPELPLDELLDDVSVEELLEVEELVLVLEVLLELLDELLLELDPEVDDS